MRVFVLSCSIVHVRSTMSSLVRMQLAFLCFSPSNLTCFVLQQDGTSYVLEVAPPSYAEETGRGQADPSSVKAPMTGRIDRVLVVPGQVVTKDTPLAIMEAMKMEVCGCESRQHSMCQLEHNSRVLKSFNTDAKPHWMWDIRYFLFSMDSSFFRLVVCVYVKCAVANTRRSMLYPLQHVLKAPMDGVVDRIGAQPGQIVQQNSLVVKLIDAAAAAQA